MDTVMVTAIGGNVGHGILKSLQGQVGRRVGIDTNQYPVGMDCVDAFYQVPAAIDPDYVNQLLIICAKESVRILIPVNEQEIRILSRHRDVFLHAAVKLMMNQPAILDTCFDKYRTAEFLSEFGIAVPHTWLAENFVQTTGDYILKPRESCGSKSVTRIHSFHEIDESAKAGAIVQEYIPSEDSEYTVSIFSDGRQVNVIAFRRTLEHGYTSFVELVHDDSLIELAHTIATAFNLQGVLNIQLRKHEGKNYVFEINPRLSGTVHFRHMMGFTDVYWWMDLLRGRNVLPYCCEYQTAIGVRELNEKFLISDKWKKERN